MSAKTWLRRGLYAVVALLVLGAIAIVVGGAMGLFAGKRPADAGFTKGAFAPGDWKPNWVSSTVPKDDIKHYIAPIAITGDPTAAWPKLDAVIAKLPRATVVKRDPGYMHVEFASARLGFVDDVQFVLDGESRVIHVKSGARLGVRDFSVNRDRVELIRRAMAAP